MKITGKVIDSTTAAPLEYATITMFLQGNKKPLTGTTTNEAGNFTLTGVPPGTFNVIVEFIGYQPFKISNLKVIQKKS